MKNMLMTQQRLLTWDMCKIHDAVKYVFWDLNHSPLPLAKFRKKKPIAKRTLKLIYKEVRVRCQNGLRNLTMVEIDNKGLLWGKICSDWRRKYTYQRATCVQQWPRETRVSWCELFNFRVIKLSIKFWWPITNNYYHIFKSILLLSFEETT